MQVSRINLVSVELVSISELKTYMRIEHDVEDALLKSLQRAAYDWVEQFTGRVYIDYSMALFNHSFKGKK